MAADAWWRWSAAHHEARAAAAADRARGARRTRKTADEAESRTAIGIGTSSANVAMIESDNGVFRPLGFGVAGTDAVRQSSRPSPAGSGRV
jgi:hypothetical protein